MVKNKNIQAHIRADITPTWWNSGTDCDRCAEAIALVCKIAYVHEVRARWHSLEIYFRPPPDDITFDQIRKYTQDLREKVENLEPKIDSLDTSVVDEYLDERMSALAKERDGWENTVNHILEEVAELVGAAPDEAPLDKLRAILRSSKQKQQSILK